MIHPSYTELIDSINAEVEDGDTPVVNSRFSIVMAASKRARQIIDKNQNLEGPDQIHKPLSTAVAELYAGDVKILPEDETVAAAPAIESPVAEEAVIADEAAPENAE